jgi:glycosyltransferase involved in cell wall biosynthesis
MRRDKIHLSRNRFPAIRRAAGTVFRSLNETYFRLAVRIRQVPQLLWWLATFQLVSRLRLRRRRRLESKTIGSSTLFDRDWYCRKYPDVRQWGFDEVTHYLAHGAAEGRDPGPLFDTAWYLDRYPDVGKSGLNPLVHYLKHGAAEGRDPKSPGVNRLRSDLPVASLPLASLRRWSRPPSAEPGVNLIGPVEFLHGLGTSARGFMAALSRAGIRLNVIPWRMGFERLRPVAVDCPSAELQPINLVHLNLDLLASGCLLDNPPLADVVTRDRYNIVIPYWELASVPVEWIGVLRRFDEIWCASSFIACSMTRISTRPVRIIRPAIEFAPVQGSKTRSDFGIPEDRFVFFYAADAGSILARKNPGALVEAYIEEFAPGEGACCLLKIPYSDASHPEIRDILSIAGLRPDVIFMDRLLDGPAMRNLYELIDCYVSAGRMREGLVLESSPSSTARLYLPATT